MTMKKDFLLFVFPLFLSCLPPHLPHISASFCAFISSVRLYIYFLFIYIFFFTFISILVFFPVSVHWGQVYVSVIHPSPPLSIFLMPDLTWASIMNRCQESARLAHTHALQNRVPPRPVSAAIGYESVSCHASWERGTSLAGERRGQFSSLWWLSWDPARCDWLTDTCMMAACLKLVQLASDWQNSEICN